MKQVEVRVERNSAVDHELLIQEILAAYPNADLTIERGADGGVARVTLGVADQAAVDEARVKRVCDEHNPALAPAKPPTLEERVAALEVEVEKLKKGDA